ncbi:MAG TPA: carboxypeptidase-like regulatory domain-containing protein [Candidatus Sulfotelmatobacter sp.]|nr:carboxypeptidase-like regulatory domain-containing protein [Candidatus Sulfotelmatobacter sp.]
MRWSNPFLLAAFTLLFSSLTPSSALAQQSFSEPACHSALPDAPQPAQTTESNKPPPTGAGSIAGTVLDANRDALPGALVTLAGSSGSATASAESGTSGEFTFTGLPPDVYRLTVTAPGMLPFSSLQISLQAGETRLVPPMTLSVFGGTTNVTVNGSPEQLSRQQAQIALQQRIVGVIPNFYSTYDWNAPPLLARQKFRLGIHSIIDPVSLFGVAVTAGAEQYQNVFPAYGSGVEGYGKRYGAALANHVSATLLGRAVYPSLFHQDPRYFYKGKGSIRSRALYAISSAFVARGDDGRRQPNYSRLLGNFSAAAISNLYYPASDRGASLVVLNGLATTGGDIVANLTREFLLKHFTSHVPKSANGEP